MKPTIGRIVLYALSDGDADAINVRRRDYRAFEAGHKHPHEPGTSPATGHIAHYGNDVAAGDEFPAMVVRDWNEPAGTVNLQVHLDGNDIYWATSRLPGDGPGTWHWPEREPDNSPQIHVDTGLSDAQVKQVVEQVQASLLVQARRSRHGPSAGT